MATRPASATRPLAVTAGNIPANAGLSDWGAEQIEPGTYDPIASKKWAKDSTLVVVDLRHLCYRAFFTIDPRPLDHSQKSMTLRIVLDSLEAICTAANTSHVVLVDDGSIAYKRKAHPGYKDRQDKKDDPERIRESEIQAFHFDTTRDFLKKCHVPYLHLPDIEADDAAGLLCGAFSKPSLATTLGILAHHERPLPKRILLVTDDKDYYQLVRRPDGVAPEVLIWRGVLKKIIDHADFVARHGFQPEQYPDYKALVGEAKTGDNIPGVPSIGDVTAGKMVAASGTLEGIIDYCKQALAAGKPKKVEMAVFNHEADARLSLRLSTIARSTADLITLWGFSKQAAAAMLDEVEQVLVHALGPAAVRDNKPDLSVLLRDGVNPERAVAALRRMGTTA